MPLFFPEFDELERVLESLPSSARVSTLAVVSLRNREYPVYGVALGNPSADAPSIGFFAGVHGLERIGTRVVLAYLSMLSTLLKWDRILPDLLERIRIVFVPLVNPGGMATQSRANPNGVDLMRNAPVEAENLSRLFLPAGHRFSPRLPWYRGSMASPMEKESQAVCDFVRQELFPSKVSLSLDVHSGYGAVDRLWFPYAKSPRPFASLAEVFALNSLLDKTLPHHVYHVEPQSKQYTTHGDLWDFLYDEHRAHSENLFLPFSLEMGSWNWIKKNPRQLFSALGVFNPLLPHRSRRTLRRHLPLFDFLTRAVNAHESWARLESNKRDQFDRSAKDLWYPKAA